MGRAQALEVALKHYGSFVDAAASVNNYRIQVVTLWVTVFAPVAASLVVLVAKSPSDLSDYARSALAATLWAFGLVSLALGFWAWRMHDHQCIYRKQMMVIMDEVRTYFGEGAEQTPLAYLVDDPWRKRSRPLLAWGLGVAGVLGCVAAVGVKPFFGG